MSALVHYLYGGIRLQTTHDRLSGAAQAQLSVLLGLFVLAKAGDYWLDRFDLVHQGGRLITGITYTDDHAVLPAKEILMGIAVICAVLFFLNVWRRTWMLPSVGLALLALSAMLLGLIWPGIVQQFQVDPTEADKEAPYIESNIEATRAAYDLDDVEVEPFTSQTTPDDSPAVGAGVADLVGAAGRPPAGAADLRAEPAGPRLLLGGGRARRRPLPDRGHDQRALVLGVRELDQAGISASRPELVEPAHRLHPRQRHHRRLRQPAAARTTARSRRRSSGPRASRRRTTSPSCSPTGTRPGSTTASRAPTTRIVGKSAADSQDVELDLRQRGEGEDAGSGATTTFDGDGGVDVGGLSSQVLYAVRFGDPNFVLSERVNEQQQGALLPQAARAGREGRAVADARQRPATPRSIDGRIVWIIDGYTTTDRYPLAERESFETMTDDSLADRHRRFGTLPTDEINYMRNAVKATVDAYDGTVNLYAWDESDPILKAWRGAFPGTVQDRVRDPRRPDGAPALPRGPVQGAALPVRALPRHRRERLLPGQQPLGGAGGPVHAQPVQPPYRLFVNEPTDTGAEQFSLTSVYVPSRQEQPGGVRLGDSDATDPDDYGKMRVLQLPNEQTPGPGQVANEMATDQRRADALAGVLGRGDVRPSTATCSRCRSARG